MLEVCDIVYRTDLIFKWAVVVLISCLHCVLILKCGFGTKQKLHVTHMQLIDIAHYCDTFSPQSKLTDYM